LIDVRGDPPDLQHALGCAGEHALAFVDFYPLAEMRGDSANDSFCEMA
jgi:hypothetical protein